MVTEKEEEKKKFSAMRPQKQKRRKVNEGMLCTLCVPGYCTE